MTPTPRRAPTPKGELLIGHARMFSNDPLPTVLRWNREVGDIARLRLGPFTAHVLFHPDHVRYVLQENSKNYDKQTRGFAKLRLFLGNGLLTSEGSFWLRQRRIAQPAFHRQRIAALGPVMTRATERLLARWDALPREGPKGSPSGVIDAADEMMTVTREIVGETLLGADVSSEARAVGPALTLLSRELDARISSIYDPPLSWPLPRNRRFLAAQRVLDDVVVGIIRERRRGGNAGKHDLLAMLMEARDEETGETMSDAQLRDEAMTIFAAGHETTSNALTWTFLLLSRNPTVDRKLHDELTAVLAGRTPTMDDLPKLPYLRMVLQESMRLFPPAWMIGRAPLTDDTIGGYHIPARSLVFVCPWATHRHPCFWDNPEGFDPERFTPERSESRPSFAYFPFGGGPRLCIGNNFAMLESALILATIAQRYRLELVPGHPVEMEPLITLRPAQGMKMTLRRRGT